MAQAVGGPQAHRFLAKFSLAAMLRTCACKALPEGRHGFSPARTASYSNAVRSFGTWLKVVRREIAPPIDRGRRSKLNL